MAKPAHPDLHDPLVKQNCEAALEGEVLIPVPDRATAQLIRSRLYSFIRAHKDWRTGEYAKFSAIRTKMVRTSAAKSVRSAYYAEQDIYPYTLVLDTRDAAAAALESAVNPGASPTPITGAVHKQGAVRPDNDHFEEEIGEEEEEPSFAAITKRYKI